MKQNEFFSVLTGDIINSTSLSRSELELVRSDLLNAIGEIKGWTRGLVKGKAEFFRGDAWQLLLAKPAHALRAAIFLRATLLAGGMADSRVSIGMGRVENVSSNRVSLSTGEAFIVSGHGLDNLLQHSNMTIEIPDSSGVLSAWLPVVAQLCDALVGQWTERQAEIVCFAVHPDEPTHESIAQMLNPIVSKQAVSKALNGANWHAIRRSIRCFESTSWESVFRPKE